ncbi:hypothetical protein PT2222_20018 [Paraburkholderia tropica]
MRNRREASSSASPGAWRFIIRQTRDSRAAPRLREGVSELSFLFGALIGPLRERGDGVHIARGAVGGSGQFELRAANAVRILHVDFALARDDAFRLLAARRFEQVRGRRGVEKDRDSAIGRRIGEGIGGDDGRHLGGVAQQHADGFARVSLEARFELLLHARCGEAAVEHDIAAGDIGAHVGETERFAHRAQFGHGEFAGAADIHGAQQGDIGRGRHRLIILRSVGRALWARARTVSSAFREANRLTKTQ